MIAGHLLLGKSLSVTVVVLIQWKGVYLPILLVRSLHLGYPLPLFRSLKRLWNTVLILNLGYHPNFVAVVVISLLNREIHH
jgi:hypothetical protein